MIKKSVPRILGLGFALSSFGLLSLNTDSVQAATLTFDFTTGGGNLGPSVVVNDTTSTESVTVNGIKNLPLNTSGDIFARSSNPNPGYGINGSPRGNRIAKNNSNQEALEFDFGEVVTLESIDFTAFRGQDSFDLLIDGVPFSSDESLGSTININQMGTVFTFTPFDNGSRFRISGLVAEFEDGVMPPPSTPEPYSSTTIILLGGLFALSRFRRKTNYLNNQQ